MFETPFEDTERAEIKHVFAD